MDPPQDMSNVARSLKKDSELGDSSDSSLPRLLLTKTLYSCGDFVYFLNILLI